MAWSTSPDRPEHPEVCVACMVASTAVGDLLREAPRRAHVVAVLPAAVYLEVPGAGAAAGSRWVALLARDAVHVPIGLVTALPRRDEPFADLREGSAAVIGGGALALTGPAAEEYRPIRYWDPAVPRLGGALAARPVARRAEALALLAAGLPADDVLRWGRRVTPLEAALAPPHPDAAQVAEAVEALVGLGPGLTPAGDDVLAGALVTLAAAADVPRRRALTTAVHDLLPRTTPISGALLVEACHGRCVPELTRVLRALAGSGDLDAALARLATVGHTSGAALALGVRAAVRARAGHSLGRCA